MNTVKGTFFKIAKTLIASGDEQAFHKHLPEGVQFDKEGNAWLVIGDSPTTMFAAHMDTVATKTQRIKINYDGRFASSASETILGADDKAGITCLLELIKHNVPGLYYFFVYEEGGANGSRYAAHAMHTKLEDSPITKHSLDIKRVISFDRYGYSSIISYQSGGTCASPEFVQALSDEFLEQGMFMTEDTGGVFTDSACFVELVPECTNISVGYFDQHTSSETQDIPFLTKLCEAIVRIDWESLPAERSLSSKSSRRSVYDYGKEDKKSTYGSKSYSDYFRYKDDYPLTYEDRLIYEDDLICEDDLIYEDDLNASAYTDRKEYETNDGVYPANAFTPDEIELLDSLLWDSADELERIIIDKIPDYLKKLEGFYSKMLEDTPDLCDKLNNIKSSIIIPSEYLTNAELDVIEGLINDDCFYTYLANGIPVGDSIMENYLGWLPEDLTDVLTFMNSAMFATWRRVYELAGERASEGQTNLIELM